jgi:hypothetical protein
MKRKQWTAGSVAKASGKAFGGLFELPMKTSSGVAKASGKALGGVGNVLELHAKKLMRKPAKKDVFDRMIGY